MTEVFYQMATNPLPPASRLPGSVGLPSGVEVHILFAPDGSRMTNGGPGEVAIRGKSVTRGYEGVDAEEFLFPGGWLRTGDEGRLDEHGYLHLVGRLKEFCGFVPVRRSARGKLRRHCSHTPP